VTSPRDVGLFHAEFDRHPDDRIRLFEALSTAIDPDSILYPGSYVDIAPSVFFDDVEYVDTDKRAAVFFGERDGVRDLIARKRSAIGGDRASTDEFRVGFQHTDYSGHLPVDDASVQLLVSLYAGFVSEHCTRYLAPGGWLLANNSHGDASMASLDPQYDLTAVVTHREGRYRIRTDDLDSCLVPKKGEPPTVDELHQSGRGVAYTTSPFAYVFRRS